MPDHKKLLDMIGNVDMDKIPEPLEKRIDHMICILDEVVDDLSDWEKEFVYDCSVTFTKGFRLSKKQINRLEEIYKRYGD